jgi:hypothetical protein
LYLLKAFWILDQGADTIGNPLIMLNWQMNMGGMVVSAEGELRIFGKANYRSSLKGTKGVKQIRYYRMVGHT